MEYKIRDANKGDMPAVLRLIRELADFEKELAEVETTVEDLERDGFGEAPAFHCFIAESDGNVVGMALVFWRYSTWKGRALHLEDLIVTESARGNGIGNALLTEVVRYGAQQGCKRIQWEVLDWNEGAIKFYESKGAKVLRDWNVVHLRETAIGAYLQEK
jgi:GNAT superfamily N-acetyltransferase